MMDRVEIDSEIHLSRSAHSLARLSVDFIVRDNIDVIKLFNALTAEKQNDLAKALKNAALSYLDSQKAW